MDRHKDGLDLDPEIQWSAWYERSVLQDEIIKELQDQALAICDYIKSNGMWHGTALNSIKFVFRAYGIDQEVL